MALLDCGSSCPGEGWRIELQVGFNGETPGDENSVEGDEIFSLLAEVDAAVYFGDFDKMPETP